MPETHLNLNITNISQNILFPWHSFQLSRLFPRLCSMWKWLAVAKKRYGHFIRFEFKSFGYHIFLQPPVGSCLEHGLSDNQCSAKLLLRPKWNHNQTKKHRTMFHLRPFRIPFVLLKTSWNYLICCLHHTDPRSVAFANIYLFTQVHLVFDLSYFYASAFRRRRHYVFGLSVRPSVRPKPEIPSFDLYMGLLVHPTNRNRLTACPSVCPSVRPPGEVSGHLPENAWSKWPESLHADVS